MHGITALPVFVLFRAAISSKVDEASGKIFSLPEMLFDQNRVVLQHEESGVSIELSAEDALRAWREADNGMPLQVSVAKVSSAAMILSTLHYFGPSFSIHD